jgi:hypothetical protein
MSALGRDRTVVRFCRAPHGYKPFGASHSTENSASNVRGTAFALPNTYDSLADAYLAAGEKDQAQQNSKKVLELLPTDKTDSEARRNAIRISAEEKITQLDKPISK